MGKALTFILLILISFLINILDTTLLSPSSGNYFFPDLNLILVIYISINRNLPYGILIVLLNGYLMDLSSGYMLGIHTFSRLSLFIILRSSSDHFNFENIMPRLIALFFGTIYVWLFLWFIIFLKSAEEFNVGVNMILHQAVINSIVGIILFQFTYRIHAELQK